MSESLLTELRQWCDRCAEAAFIRANDPAVSLLLQMEATGWAGAFAEVIDRIDGMNPANANAHPPPTDRG